MRFWETHAKEMRRARLLQAAAVLYSGGAASKSTGSRSLWAVEMALELEGKINALLPDETKKSEVGNCDASRRPEQ